MADRPILFSGAMVRAILDGRKTQTRRVVKPQPTPGLDGWDWSWPIPGKDVTPGTFDRWRDDAKNPISPRYCPYGQPGDRLWVRETTRSRLLPNPMTGEPTNALCGEYTADGSPVVNRDGFDLAWWYSRDSCPSIHMPRDACRLVLEITAVHVERLNDCSEADAIAEGIEPFTDFRSSGYWKRYRDGGCTSYVDNPIASYASLWTEINGAGAWEKNPWVWVVEFRRVM